MVGGTARGNTCDYVATTVARIDAVIRGCGFQRLADMNALRVAEWLAAVLRPGAAKSYDGPAGAARSYREIAEAFEVGERTVTYWRKQGAPIVAKRENDLEAIWRWLQERRQARGDVSIGTRNHYLRAIKSFGQWLVREQRLVQNPFLHLSSRNAETDRRRLRRILSEAEFESLIESASASSQSYRGLRGIDRAMLYLMAAYTGLRAAELASLGPESLSLGGDSPTVTVEAAYSKRRRRDVLPLRKDLAERLGEWLRESTSAEGAPLWPGSWADEAADMLRRDLAAAKIPLATGAESLISTRSGTSSSAA